MTKIPTPRLDVKVTKKPRVLTLDFKGNILDLTIKKGCIDLIQLDMWITDLLMDIHDKVENKKKLKESLGAPKIILS
jgi:hypothetical protein